MRLVISSFLDGSWSSDPEDGKFAARLWTQSGTICSSSWYQSCTHSETRRYDAHNSSSTVTRQVEFTTVESVIQIYTHDFSLLCFFFPIHSCKENLPERLFLSDSFPLKNF